MRRLLLFVFSHRTLALLRWDLHFLAVRLGNLVFRRNARVLKRIRASRPPLYLNLGSGPRGVKDEHWLNVDGYKDTNVEYLMDFNRQWPFPNDSFNGLFCEHVLEHFDLDEGRAILSESLRVLSPGGCIRVIVPDGEKILECYSDAPSELLARRETETAMEAVNSYFRQRYEHQFIYDWSTLKRQLESAGFAKVNRVAHGRADMAVPLVIDDEKYAWESLYVEAVKSAD